MGEYRYLSLLTASSSDCRIQICLEYVILPLSTNRISSTLTHHIVVSVVFPGGILPTVTLINSAITSASSGRLLVESISNIGPHYARTLREWRRRFDAGFVGDGTGRIEQGESLHLRRDVLAHRLRVLTCLFCGLVSPQTRLPGHHEWFKWKRRARCI